MAKKKSYEERFKGEDKLLKEEQSHQADSEKHFQTRRGDWDDLESIWYARNEDALTKQNKSKIFNPVLANIAIERSGRIMAQYPTFKVEPKSGNDVGKNQLVNLLLRHYMKQSCEQYSFMTKIQYATQFDKVYGSQFLLVPWRVKADYAGPEVVLLDPWDAYPQPGVTLNDADWFIHRTVVNINWLVNQAKKSPDVWNKDAIMTLAAKMKADKDSGDSIDRTEHKSYNQRKFYPNKTTDTAYPNVELYTSYRRNKWITWTPQRVNDKTSKPYVLRVVENPYPGEILPVTAKHCFPMLKSALGFGEFERGKSLQYGMNSLINLYLTGLKYSIFPPLHVNPDEVNVQSLKWGANYWLMDRPNQSVQQMGIRPQLEQFQSVYGLFNSAMQELGGTTQVNKGQQSESNIGKTPQAINYMAMQQAARDSIDQRMLEETLTEIGKRWVALLTDPEKGKLTEEVAVRLYGDEIRDIAEQHPDVLELFNEQGTEGQVTINSERVQGKYDLEVEAGSTLKPDEGKDEEMWTSVIKAAMEPSVMQSMQMSGKQFDMAELMKRWLVAKKIRDVDRVIIDAQQQPGMPGETGQMPVDPQQEAQMQQEQAMMQQAEMERQQKREQMMQQAQNIQDPDIADMVGQVLGGTSGIPPTNNPGTAYGG
jgi:hypothetical protein